MADLAKIVGIVAEYHPFHNGHLYQMQRARAMTGADYCVVFLSSYFVQRGMPALYSTRARAEAALRCGADAVFEIPSPFSSASARDYAHFAVSLMLALGITQLSCGAEGSSAEELSSLCDCIQEEAPVFRECLRRELKNGLSFPAARRDAILRALSAAGAESAFLSRAEALLVQPNTILALEYTRAARECGAPLCISLVPRKGSAYHEPLLCGQFSSATAIRKHILSHGTAPVTRPASLSERRICHRNSSSKASPDHAVFLKTLSAVMPPEALSVFSALTPLNPDVLCGSIERRVLDLLYEGQTLSDYADVSPALAARIAGISLKAVSFEALVSALKTRQYTHTRVARALIHLFLGIKKRDMERWKADSSSLYARLLGFRRESAALLSVLKQQASVPLLSRSAAAESVLTEPAARALFRAELHAARLWNSLLFEATGNIAPDPLTQQVIVI